MRTRTESALLILILLVAFGLRVWDLGSFPAGLHGDEGVTGTEAIRVVDEGGIGVYSGSALGQPTAPFYLTALSVVVFGETAFAIRLVSALAGVATVYATYRIARVKFGAAVGLASGAVLSVLVLHLHYSRIAFGVIWWPLSVLVAIALVDRAAQTNRIETWALAGAAAAFGVYIYNAHWTFGIGLAVLMAIRLLWRWPRMDRSSAIGLGAFVGGGLVTLAPMFRYMADSSTSYSSHAELVSIFSRPQWQDGNFFDRIGQLIGNYASAWDVLLFRPSVDFADGTGQPAPVPTLIGVAVIAGIALILWKHRTFFGALLLLTLAVMPVGPAITVDGLVRRQFGVAAVLAVVAGLAFGTLYEQLRARNQGRLVPTMTGGFAVLLTLSIVGSYFVDFRGTQEHERIFGAELTRPAELMNEYDEAFVNFRSERFGYRYESLQFLAPDVHGSDRSTEHSATPGLHLEPDVDGDQLFILLGRYVEDLAELEQLYPDGQVVENEIRYDIAVAAYLVPG